MRDPYNAKEHYQSFTRNKTKKSVKQSEIKFFDIVDIKLVITEYQKTAHKLP